MGVVVLEERNQGCSDRSHLVRSDIHIVDLFLGYDREICLETALDAVILDFTVVRHLDICEGYELILFLLCAHVFPSFIREIDLSSIYLAVRGLDETESIDTRIDAERGDKTDVRAFRRLDRAEAAIMGVVDVSDLESGPVPGKTSRTESGKTPLVGNLREGVGLVHELGELARTEERIDNGRESLRVDQVYRAELLAVADIHLLADGPCHSGETYAELVGELLAYGSYATVRQVVDIVYGRLRVDELNEILDNLDDVGICENPH